MKLFISSAARVAVLLSAALPAFVQATDLTSIGLEDLSAMTVTSASKFAQSGREAPSSVEVITREDIRRHGWRTLSQVLSSLPGVYSSNDRAYDYLGGRGFLIPGDYNTRFLLLVDGQRTNDNIYEQATFGNDFSVDLGLIERIEYVPGPGSSIYGSNAIFGVINVITRRGNEMPPLQMSLTLSDHGAWDVSTTMVHRLDSGATLTLSGRKADKPARDETYDDPTGGLTLLGGAVSPDGRASGMDRDEVQQLYARYEDGGLDIALRHVERLVQPSSALYGSLFNDPGLRLEDQVTSIAGRYRRQLDADAAVELRLEYGQMTYKADYPYEDTGTNTRYINRDDTIGQWWAGEARLTYTGFAGHKLTGGVEFQTDTKARQRNFDLGAAVNTPVDIDNHRRRHAVYLQNEWAFAKDWRLNAGLRLDSFSSADSETSPRLGLIWLASEDTTLKLLAGRAFRVPNAYEEDFDNGVYLGNTALKPESIRTVEAVWEQRLGRRHGLRVSVFDYKISDLIQQMEDTATNTFQYQNMDDVTGHGVEMAWRHAWESEAFAAASLGLVHTEDSAGRRVGFSPPWLFKLRGGLPLPGGTWQLTSEVLAVGNTKYYWNGNPYRLDTRVTADLVVLPLRPFGGWDGHLRVRNLFDRKFDFPASADVPVPAVPGHRLGIEAGLRYAF